MRKTAYQTLASCASAAIAMLAFSQPATAAAATKSRLTCADVSNTYGNFAAMRDQGVSKEAIQAAIDSDTDNSLDIKLTLLSTLEWVYKNQGIAPDVVRQQTLARCSPQAGH